MLIGNSSVSESAHIWFSSYKYRGKTNQRERSSNVIDVSYEENEIYHGIKLMLSKKRAKRSTLYGDGSAGKKIFKILNKII